VFAQLEPQYWPLGRGMVKQVSGLAGALNAETLFTGKDDKSVFRPDIRISIPPKVFRQPLNQTS
jgi:hypothetical protein